MSNFWNNLTPTERLVVLARMVAEFRKAKQ